MKKNFYLYLFAGVFLAGCSSSDVETTYEKEVLQHRQMPINFSTFLGSNAITRSGETGTITDDALKASASKGFGVFAYYTDNEKYNATTSVINFMYNEQVKYKNGNWTYDPIKYWPNEYGTDAISTNVDYLSFQAYAPWVGKEDGTNIWLGGLTEGATPSVEVGITGFTNSDGSSTDNTVTGDVYVNYNVASDPANSVDLLYATNAVTEYNVTTPNDGLMNMTKQPVNTPVTFKFAHALSRLGVKIRAVVNKTADEDSNLDNHSTIILNSITIQSNAMGKQGKLNLRTGDWTVTGQNYSLNIEGSNIKLSGTNKNEVTTTYQDVMGSDKFFMFIPTGESTTYNVTVDYTVTTEDIALVTGKSVVNNRITKSLTFTPEKSKAYNLNLLIGLTSVELKGEVTDWANTSTSAEIWLPINQ